MSGNASRFRPAWWMRGAHAQTVWGRFMRRFPRLDIRRELILATDGEWLELQTLDGRVASPRVVLLHGLEGSSRSHYVGGLLAQAHSRGWPATLLLFRGCGSAPNVSRRFYHSGETSDLATVFAQLSARAPEAEWMIAGVSLGGNVLLKWLGELGTQIDKRILAGATVSAPYDLEAGARHLARGRLRFYDRSFLRSLRRKALAKLERMPELFERDRLLRARSVFEFDDAVTAPVHGFRDAVDYYTRSSSEPFLRHIRVPTLLVSAADDPFLPRDVFERVRRTGYENTFVTLDFTEAGGHVGFVGGNVPWRTRYYAEERVFDFFDATLKDRATAGYD